MSNLLSSFRSYESLSTVSGETFVAPLKGSATRAFSLFSKKQELKVTWAEDELFFSQKPKVEYQNLRCVVPTLTDELRCDIQVAIQNYDQEQEVALSLPQSFFTLKGQHLWFELKQRQLFKRRVIKKKLTKSERLEAVFWILGELPNASSAKAAINQLACVLHDIEKKAALNADAMQIQERAFRPMRVSEPVKEIHNAQVIYASYASQHVILVRDDGAMQIQRLPVTARTLNYPYRATLPNVVLFEKAGAFSLKPGGFWQNGMPES